MPNHSRRTSRVSRKRKVNRRRTKKGGASVSGDNTDIFRYLDIDNSKGFSLLDIKNLLVLLSSPEIFGMDVSNFPDRQRKDLVKFVNDRLESSKAPWMNGKYYLGNIKLSPEEKIQYDEGRKNASKKYDPRNKQLLKG